MPRNNNRQSAQERQERTQRNLQQRQQQQQQAPRRAAPQANRSQQMPDNQQMRSKQAQRRSQMLTNQPRPQQSNQNVNQGQASPQRRRSQMLTPPAQQVNPQPRQNQRRSQMLTNQQMQQPARTEPMQNPARQQPQQNRMQQTQAMRNQPGPNPNKKHKKSPKDVTSIGQADDFSFGKDKKSKKRKSPNVGGLNKVPDYIMWALMSCLVAVSLYFIVTLDILQLTYLLAILGVATFIVLLFMICIMCRKKKSWRIWVSRVSMGVLTCVFAYTSFTLYNGSTVLYNIMNKENITQVSVLSSISAAAPTSTDDLSGKTVGYSVASDKESVCYAMSELGSEQSGVQFQAYKDYTELYQALADGKVDSIIIPNTRIEVCEEDIKGFKDNVENIKTYAYTNTTPTTKTVTAEQANEPFVVYLGGMDDGDDPSVDGRCDVNILLMVNPETATITMVSIPRDSYVPNPALYYGSDKLTHLGWDGPYNTMEALEDVFGIDIDYYAKVNFYSVIALIDALGGIDVDVEISFTEQNEDRSFAAEDLITLEAGEQPLNGQQALAYARHRHTEGYGTAGRERAQKRIITAMVKKLCSAEGLARLNNMLSVAQDYVATDIPMTIIQNLIKKQQSSDAPEWKINSVTVEQGYTASLTTVSMPNQVLSCHLLSEQDQKLVYNAYLTLQGKGVDIDTLNEKVEAYNGVLEENGVTDPTYVEFPEDVDTTFWDDLQLPNSSDYVITSEEGIYLADTQVYYGLVGYAVDSEDTSTRINLKLPNLTSGYYTKVTE